ncbi:MAG: hypothetical protein R2710_15515 [Acidimicrobiales bacterium]
MVNALRMADEILLGRIGYHRSDHHARPDQHRLRRRADGHAPTPAAPSWVSVVHQARGALAAARAAIASPLLESSIEGAASLSIAGSSELGLFEVNEAAEIIHDVAHRMPTSSSAPWSRKTGRRNRVTVIAAGFDRWDAPRDEVPAMSAAASADPLAGLLDDDDDDVAPGHRRSVRLR